MKSGLEQPRSRLFKSHQCLSATTLSSSGIYMQLPLYAALSTHQDTKTLCHCCTPPHSPAAQYSRGATEGDVRRQPPFSGEKKTPIVFECPPLPCLASSRMPLEVQRKGRKRFRRKGEGRREGWFAVQLLLWRPQDYIRVAVKKGARGERKREGRGGTHRRV